MEFVIYAVDDLLDGECRFTRPHPVAVGDVISCNAMGLEPIQPPVRSGPYDLFTVEEIQHNHEYGVTILGSWSSS